MRVDASLLLIESWSDATRTVLETTARARCRLWLTADYVREVVGQGRRTSMTQGFPPIFLPGIK